MKQIEYTPAGYWDRRYREGRTSGAGSEGEEGRYKAQYVSDFIRDHVVTSVIDHGCGDGQVLKLIDLHDARYTGVDVSPTIVSRMRRQFPALKFLHVDDTSSNWYHDLSLSMDVLFHLPSDDDYREYINRLFGTATKYVLIYSTNEPIGRTARHVFRREFTRDIAMMLGDAWQLVHAEPPLREGLASFFVYERIA